MKIAVLGGLVHQNGTHETAGEDRWWTTHEEDFVAACQEIGNRLASLEHELVVATDDPGTADRHATEGVEQVMLGSQGAKGRVHVIRPDRQEDIDEPFLQLRRQFGTRIRVSRWGPPSAEFQKLAVMKNADATVCLGGAEKTFFAGIAGAVSGKRVVPIGWFGGAGAQLRSTFSGGRWGEHIPRTEVLEALDNPWGPDSSKALLTALNAEAGRTLRIFIVHGRSEDRNALAEYLRRVGDETSPAVKPIVMINEELFGLTLPEKFQTTAGSADAAIVLATPDDIGGVAGDQAQLLRARENVWLEFGWFWGAIGLRRVLCLIKGDVLKPPSDAQGLLYATYKEHPQEAGETIRTFLRSLTAANQETARSSNA